MDRAAGAAPRVAFAPLHFATWAGSSDKDWRNAKERKSTGRDPVAGTSVKDPSMPRAGSTFSALHLDEQLLRALSELGYEEPTPIQQEAIPPLLEGRDLLGQAATGTGKTAAFALPILDRLDVGPRQRDPVALVLVPTRALAIQVSEAIHRYGVHLDARVVPIYGGQAIGRQLNTLARGVDVVVATPGRALDHIGRGTLRLTSLQVVVLDEADEMLDMGFAEDIEAILGGTPEGRQFVLFSATMPSRVDHIARRYLKNPIQIRLATKLTEPGETARVRQNAYVIPRGHKPAALGRILDVESPAAAVVFCRTRAEVELLTESLNGSGYSAEALHGGMDQEQRDRVMGRLRSGTTELLVATDVAARGLDIDHLTHVVNYDVPSAPDAYVHRIGRVGRAGREGVAITLAEPREQRLLQAIERVTKQPISIEKLPSIADLRVRRLERTRAALYEYLVGGDTERFRVVVDTLADDFDLLDIATAAVKMAYEATGAAAVEKEIPEVAFAPRQATAKTKTPTQGGLRSDRPVGVKKGGGHKGTSAAGRRGSRGDGGLTSLFIGVGAKDGIRAKDLVGAITGETRLSGQDIGKIKVSDRYSLAEVPEGAVEEVIDAMRNAKIKGKKASIRRER